MIDLRTPESKTKLKGEDQSPTRRFAPKKLKFTCSADMNDIAETSEVKKPCPSIETEIDRLTEEKECLRQVICQKKDDIVKSEICTRSTQTITNPRFTRNVICDNCHHRGHRASGNKGGIKCPFVQCAGFHYCGFAQNQ